MVVARTQHAAAVLSADLKAHRIQREYEAFIGAPLPEGLSGTIDLALRWSGGRCWVDKSGAPAVTHFEVLGRVGDHTKLRVRLETGRMHQIRVHLSSVGHPVAGDRLYGAPAKVEGRPSLDRFFLHAHRLGFTSPSTGRSITVEARLPAELEAWMEGLEARDAGPND